MAKVTHYIITLLLLVLTSTPVSASVQSQCTHMQQQNDAMSSMMAHHAVMADSQPSQHDCCEQDMQCTCPDSLCHAQAFIANSMVVASTVVATKSHLQPSRAPTRLATSLFRPPIIA
ncbi:hypothetical protein FIU82_13060 [Pseudoalteromonas sp. THAF3]|uniref:hypothetical protein n=1 Tax=Pseudoalteromonas TaxID=53246 RepID=UPI001246FD52|nr:MULTISPECIES: hypothetical protein [Pseudoalteromonas]MCG7570578.1 hypothetical protein [Pseudoalteromonas sp. CNC9-20]QFU05916.1 hypothetical protein FIU82_13060 [Pseudoalteromonas sp. THAF3]